MQIQLQLCLPRESRYVPVLRSTTSQLLVDLGVSREDVGDVELALTEACANVVRHAVDTSEYVVEVAVNDEECRIVVCDQGPGFDPDEAEHAREEALTMAEAGRGLALMSALVDDVSFERQHKQHSVELRKCWEDPISGAPAAGGPAAASEAPRG